MKLEEAQQSQWTGNIEQRLEAICHLWNWSHGAEMWAGDVYYPPEIKTREQLLSHLHAALQSARQFWKMIKNDPDHPFHREVGRIEITIAGLKKAIKMLKSGQDLSWADIPIKEEGDDFR
jgi:hypothetical protein